MSGFGNATKGRVLDHLFGKATWTPPTSFWVALSTSEPLDNGTNVSEPGSNYARQETTASWWNTAVVNDQTTITNALEIAFPFASGGWGLVTHVALFDASTGGEMIASGPLVAPVNILNNYELKFPINNLTLQLD